MNKTTQKHAKWHKTAQKHTKLCKSLRNCVKARKTMQKPTKPPKSPQNCTKARQTVQKPCNLATACKIEHKHAKVFKCWNWTTVEMFMTTFPIYLACSTKVCGTFFVGGGRAGDGGVEAILWTASHLKLLEATLNCSKPHAS
jgi:hypothetical protein